VTIPGDAGTASRGFFTFLQATPAGPMPRIVSYVTLSLTFFPPKCSILNYLCLFISAVFHHPLHSPTIRLLAPLYTLFHLSLPDSPLASSTLYSLSPVTPSEVFKILKTSPFKSSTLDFLPSSLLKSCPTVFSDLIAPPCQPVIHSGSFSYSFQVRLNHFSSQEARSRQISSFQLPPYLQFQYYL